MKPVIMLDEWNVDQVEEWISSLDEFKKYLVFSLSLPSSPPSPFLFNASKIFKCIQKSKD